MKICVVIPFYNHGDAIAAVIASLRSLELPAFVVDDLAGLSGIEPEFS